MMIMPVSKYYLDKATAFAEEQLEGSKKLYAYRGEKNIEKIKQDIIIGKLGEVAVYQYLKERDYEANKPDFTIYDRINKSYAADITSGKYSVHVKSQGVQSVLRYGNSWLLQRNDKLVRDPLRHEYLAFTNVDLDSMTVRILGVVKMKDIVDGNLLDECKVFRYRTTKVALYWENIKEVLTGHRRWRL